MPIRPTIGGFQTPQWLLDAIRNIENNIRRLEDSINSLKRGELLSPVPKIQDTSGSSGSGSGGGGAWNGGLGISVNSLPASANAKVLNLKSGSGVGLSKNANALTGQVDVTITNASPQLEVQVEGDLVGDGYSPQVLNFTGGAGVSVAGGYNNGEITITTTASNIPSVVSNNCLVHHATSDTLVTGSYVEVSPLTVTIPTNTDPSPGFRLCKFEAHVILKNASNSSNRDAYLKVVAHTNTITPDNTMFVGYTWGVDHNDSAWYSYPNSLSSSTEVHITGIPAGSGYPFSGEPNYLSVAITGTTQYHTEHDTLIKFYVHDGTGSGLYVAQNSNIIITPLS